MAKLFTLSGSWTVAPPGSVASGVISAAVQLDERLSVGDESFGSPVTLSSDAPVSVPVPASGGAAVLCLKVTSGAEIVARITTAAGTTQIVPVDSFLLLESRTSPITALTLTRTPATATTVEVFLGAQA